MYFINKNIFMIFIFLFTVDVYANMYNKAEAEFRNGNITNSLKIFKQSCKKKNANSCGMLGYLYEGNKKQVRKDMSKSIYYYELGCTYGDYKACGILGDIYLKKAIKVQKKSCELGHKNSCRYYQQLKKI